MSLFEIKCPMCKGSLWVDQSTGKVVDHKSAEQQSVDFGTFLHAQRNKNSQWDDKMKRAKDETARKKAELEERFRQAKEHPEELQGEVDSPFKWD